MWAYSALQLGPSGTLWTEVCGDVWLYRSREDVQILPHSVLCQLLCSWQKSSTEGHHHCPNSNWLPYLSLRDIANIRHLSRGQNVVKDCSHLRDSVWPSAVREMLQVTKNWLTDTHKHFLPETVHSHHTRWAVTVHTQCLYAIYYALCCENCYFCKISWRRHFIDCSILCCLDVVLCNVLDVKMLLFK